MSATNKPNAAGGAAVFTFRLPRNGETDPYFGGTRTFWNAHVLPKANRNKPPVKSIVRKQPGAKRGIRFILYNSAREFFERLAAEQTTDAKAA